MGNRILLTACSAFTVCRGYKVHGLVLLMMKGNT